ncbi:unnamed protein product [Cuscuta europaea]|uniref:DUF4218 domain-containing protein n=1 Tax=Cuscuta europaea TaxID=41803 RepID=A0A9P1E831_CUSEU|nr:unnamed protein product [Cuscuta europaea]
MHIEKNVCDNIISTILNVPGKSKDVINIRKDMVEHLNIRKELAPQPRENGFFLPPGSYTLSKAEKKSLCECLHGIKVPSGYASNIRNIVSLQDMKLIGLKSHDYHVLMQHLLPVALRGLLPHHVRHAIMRLSFFFNSICQKVIHPEKLDALQSEVVVTLCQLEMYFPPSLFDIMVHLVVHLVREVKMCGPVFLRYMYGMERHMGYLKSKVKNRCRPQGNIIRGLIDEEVIEFCTPYLTNVESLGVPKSRHDDRLEGKDTLGKKQVKNVDNDLLGKVHLLVLHHLEVFHPYVQQHMNVLRSQFPLKSEIWLTKEHNRTFASCFRDLIFNGTDNVYYDVDDDMKWLAYGPKRPIDSFEAYDINGYTFYTTRQDEKSVLHNSGVSVIASSTEYASANDQNPLNARLSYYGKIEDIWELNYTARSFAIFKCQWVDIRRGVQCDDTGVTLVDFNRSGHRGDPFIHASQAEQVFYVKDPSNE